MRDYIEERVLEIAGYILENGATVRQAAKNFGVSKSTVHKDVAERLPQIDVELAKEVIAQDDIVDDYFNRVKQDLIERISSDPSDGEFALDLLMIAKYFERIGDHATNIAEWVMFSVTGVHVQNE